MIIRYYPRKFKDKIYLRLPKMQTTDVLLRNSKAKTRIVANQGGTRSSKTYSLLQLFILRAISGTYGNKTITVVRKTFRALKRTAYRDFIEILRNEGKYNISNHNRTDHTYMLNDCMFEFIGADDDQKLRGGKRDILFCNEANELSLEEFDQLNMRTIEQVFIDYNPSDEYHWIYDYLLTREDCTYIQSTYLDNPFLLPAQIAEIELYRTTNPTKWKVYGLGERGYSDATIITNWTEVVSIPDGNSAIGIDFGFNVPSSVVKLTKHDGLLYAEQLVYQSQLTNNDLIGKLNGIDKTIPIYADAAEPARIKEIHRAGYNIRSANKDVGKGIDLMQDNKIHILSTSTDLIKEIRNYKWIEDRDGNILDKPVKENDHAMDALRYAFMGLLYKPTVGTGLFSTVKVKHSDIRLTKRR